MERVLVDLPKAERYGDCIELRLDLIENADLPRLIKAASKPVVITNRTKLEGGNFKGSEQERVEVLLQAIELEASYIDIEASTPKELLRPILETTSKTQKILSYHHFSLTPENLEEYYSIMSETPADIIKIVTYAKDICDNIIIFNLLRSARKMGRKLISFCMGELGEISRILSVHMGSFLTFASLEMGKESAPGQIPAEVLREVYRADLIDPKRKIYGVIGNPVNKSMGYVIHNRAFQENKLPHIYLPFLVYDVPRFFQTFEPFFDGLSVTMPHKEKIISSLDKIDTTAQKVGAVNTVVRDGETWVGYNTDGSGALRALQERIDLNGKEILIIGSGGAAKAIGHCLIQNGAQLTVTYNSNRERGQALAKELNCQLTNIKKLEDRKVDVLINCSPVGMAPKVEETPFPADRLQPGMLVFDTVYNPLETKLIKNARSAGCNVISGIEMFINQAVEQFEQWTKQTAPIKVMRKVVLEKLKTHP
tara:strand:+ start:2247 stop:3689 length:1443 start_codon:yes stop_codon:yes gene_type:complete